MDLVGVRVELPSNSPIVLLRERYGAERLVPIFIGAPEATAIALALDGVETPRPMTHDLMREMLEDLQVDVEKVVVTELRDKTFFAEIHLLSNGERVVVSSRPSDAMALAVRTGTPIFAADEVVEAAGYSADEDTPSDEPEVVVEQFKEFIDSVNPEDFASD